jgi:predicted metal-binding protein
MKRHTASNWEAAVLVCTKCSKKLGGGFGESGKQSLAKALRERLGIGKGRKAPLGVVEVKCLGVCPKRAVVVVNAQRPHDWMIVPAGEDVDVVLHALADPREAANDREAA